MERDDDENDGSKIRFYAKDVLMKIQIQKQRQMKIQIPITTAYFEVSQAKEGFNFHWRGTGYINIKKTSQELQMLSSVTIICQVTKIVMNPGSQLSVL